MLISFGVWSGTTRSWTSNMPARESNYELDEVFGIFSNGLQIGWGNACTIMVFILKI